MNRTLASRLETLAGCMLLGLAIVSAQSWYALRTNESLRAGLLAIAVGIAVAVFFRRSEPVQRRNELVSEIRVVPAGPSRRGKTETADPLSGQTIHLRSLIDAPRRSQAFPAAARVRRVAAPRHLHA
jgi:hypothetical protein